MPKIPALNDALRLTVNREGNIVSLKAVFGNGSTNSATLTVEQLQQLRPNACLKLKGITLHQPQARFPGDEQGDAAYLYFRGGEHDLIVVSAAALRREAGLTA